MTIGGITLHTPTEAGKLLGIKPVSVRALARRHCIGKQMSGHWMYTDADIEALRERVGMVGRPGWLSR